MHTINTVRDIEMLLDLLSIINVYLDNKTLKRKSWFANTTSKFLIISDEEGNEHEWFVLFMYYIVPCILYIEHFRDNDYTKSEIVINTKTFNNLYDYIDASRVHDIVYTKSNKSCIEICYEIGCKYY